MKHTCYIALFLLNIPCSSLLMPGYEKFMHYNPPMPQPFNEAFLQNRIYNQVLQWNQAFHDYTEANILQQITRLPILTKDEQTVISFNRGLITERFWRDENDLITINDRIPLTIQQLSNIALDRQARGVPINFNQWPANDNQFSRAGYKRALAKALYSLRNLNPQPNYLAMQNGTQNMGIANKFFLHFHLKQRTSQNMRDAQTNGYIVNGQNTIKSRINQAMNNARIMGLTDFQDAPDSAMVISFLKRQPS
jgi:hypothetical protein